MKTSLIAAISQNNSIGKDNGMIWKLSGDMKIFRTLTTGHHVIMGRKTFESMGGRILPNRTNVIISRNPDFKVEGCINVSSLEEALSVAEKNGEEEAFVIGGGEIYNLSIPDADVLYITHVRATVEGDTFFPRIDPSFWKQIKHENYSKDEKNEYDFTFCEYERIH